MVYCKICFHLWRWGKMCAFICLFTTIDTRMFYLWNISISIFN